MPLSSDSLDLDGAPLLHRHYPLLGPDQADHCFRELVDRLPWEQPRVRLFGREHPVPRLQSWHGDPGTRYRYSGLDLQPQPWTPELASIRERVVAITGEAFNSVLVNLYRDGDDTMGWHSDNEPELGPAPRVASVSLGAIRDFALRRKGESRQALTLPLRHNELIVMEPEIQHHWEHSLPRRKRVARARLNLTFRVIRPVP